MADPTPAKNRPDRPPAGISAEKYARLKEEAAAPYRGLRRFVYLACGASGALGGLIFLAQLLAGREVATALPNFAVQVVVVVLMVWLFRLDSGRRQKP